MTNFIELLLASIVFYSLGVLSAFTLVQRLIREFVAVKKELKELKAESKVRLTEYRDNIFKKNGEIENLKALSISEQKKIIEDFILFLIEKTKTNSHLNKTTWGMLKNEYLKDKKDINI